MKYVNENLYQFRDSKFFDNLFEQKEEMSPADKKKHAQELEKIGMSVVKKCIKNFSDFKKYAGDIWQEYRDFWKSQEDAGLSVEAEKEKIYLYNLYKSNYIVGIIKKDTGMAALTVFNTSAEDKDEYIVFQTQNKDVVNAFVQFYKEDLEATMKQVIANQKAAMEAKKAAEEAKTKEEKENKRKSKIEAFLGESKLDENFIFREDSGSGRSTYVLKLDEESWKKVEYLFDEDGRPKDKAIKRIPANNAVWDLYAQKYKTINDKISVKIYGVSGDYTFGNAPTFYQQKLRGNKKAAKEVYTYFIEKYLSK